MAKSATQNSRTKQDKLMAQRLGDQAKVQKNIQRLKGDGIHLNERVLDEKAFYPAHDARKESPEYAKVHHELVVTQDLPCLVCGVRDSVLKDPAKAKDPKLNPYAAKALETHHHVIEWALANAVDVGKFNATIRPHLAFRHKDNPGYQKPFNEQQVKDWVDHSPDNLWVICDVHHRAAYFGIHEITYPIWCPQDLLRADFLAYAKEQIALAKPKAKPGAKKKAPAKKGSKRTRK